jgi:DNA-directed RNA polymerase specialized sigma24 family protein
VPLDDILQEEPRLTRAAFSRLLEWLDDGVGSQGERYLEMRRRLVSYFDRRNRPSADDLAGETLSRIGRTLEKDGAMAITPPARYCYVVAKSVLLEDVRCEPLHVALGEPRIAVASAGHSVAPHEPGEGLTIEGQRLERVGRCLQELKREQRQFVVDYYHGTGRQTTERRRDMAKGLGLTLDALGIRASRIRRSLEACAAREGCST